MRARLLTAGPDAVADHELLEMVLFLALPRRDTKPIARALLSRFGSFASVISATLPELRGIEGLGEAGAAALKLVQAGAHRLLRAEVQEAPVIAGRASLDAYLRAVLGREKREQARILFLDTGNRLIADEPQGSGTLNHAPVYPREVARRALELHAAAVILVHNHPSGDPAPSREDTATTAAIAAALRTVAVALHDHVVVGRGRSFSFREAGLLPPS